MKKLLIALFTLTFVFTLSACGDDLSNAELSDLIDVVNVDTETLDASVATLQSELDALQTSLTDLEGQSDAADVLIAQILVDIADLETSLDADITANGDAIDAVDALVAGLQEQVDALEALVAELHAPKLPFLNPVDIILVHTNDVHGRVNADSWAGSMGMATIKNIVDEIDAQYDNTFLIDAGDMLHGTTFATLEEGESVLNVMNMVGYDLMVPGNHDFDYGQDRLLELEALADFDMISANIEYDVTHPDYDAAAPELFNPYVIQEFDGVKVGFFGLTSPETVYKTHPDNVTDLVFLDPVEQSQAMVDLLADQVDVIILVAHIGLDESTEITTADIADEVDGIDVIIDGHSHSTLDHGITINDTLIVSTGEYMKNLGVLQITVQGGQVIAKNSTLIDADMAEELGYGDDEEVQAYIDTITADQAVILNEVVGQTAVALDGERDNIRTGETNLGNIIADSMIEVTGADVAFTNGGGIRASIEAGDVTLGQIITVLPFGNIIHTKVVTGQVLLDMLEHGTADYPDTSGAFPSVAGITFQINTDNAEGSRVENVMVNGVALDLVAEYTLATNDFLAAGGDGYDMLVDIPTAGEYMGLHEALTSMFTVGVDIEMPTMGRVIVTPATVAAASIAPNNAPLLVNGTVTSVLPDGTFTMEDADGTAIYVDDYNEVIDFATLVVAVGDLVQVEGLKSDYNNLKMLDEVSSVSITSSGNAITAPIAVTDMQVFRDNISVDDFAKRYIFTNVEILETGYYNYFFEPVDGFDRMGIVGSYSDATIVYAAGEFATFTATFYGTNGDIYDDTKILRFSVTTAAEYVVVTPAP